ncbi:flagellar biosynthesis/type III secretory pathway chaperone [Sulfuritortus calidifontis]|uniref:Flagellar biosynthesis/type III secretory pathway chaperone n=1 Tax=Sulfuritortus calidifontis TaxID=1914471 RepID=A0A4R3JUM9_9PROT|nr:flagellar protein FlgN [Sulfuritortus calidifontis]TCS71524.1 flagellar biosynthesis/type III secretory pathway chaperone [Sulfuritortus calidifontis]
MSAIANQVKDLAAHLGLFVTLLEREHAALTAKALDDLNSIIEEKNRLAGLLGNQWSNLRSSLGLKQALPVDLKAALTARGEQAALKDGQLIGQLSERARDLNQRNGALIREQLRQTNKAIDILQTMSRQNATYGPDGLSHGGLAYSRTIDKA